MLGAEGNPRAPVVRSAVRQEGHYRVGTVAEVGPVSGWVHIDQDGVIGRLFVPRTGQRLRLEGQPRGNGTFDLVLRGFNARPAEPSPGGVIVTDEGEPWPNSTNAWLRCRIEGRQPGLTGSWSSVDGRTNARVSLDAVARRLVLRRETGVNDPLRGFVCLHLAEVAFPAFHHLRTNLFLGRLNQHLRGEAERFATQAAADNMGLYPPNIGFVLEHPEFVTRPYSRVEMHVDYASPAVVSLWVKTYDYYGGAHGEYFASDRFFVAGRGGTRAEPGLEQFFRPGTAWEARLNQAILDDLRRAQVPGIVSLLGAGQAVQAMEKAGAYDGWTVSAHGLHFYFQPGELDASWNGHRQATVAWTAMRRYLDPNGPARLLGVQFHQLRKPAAPAR
jgi:hypothetical protein